MARKERAPMAQGIGESRVFAAPEGTFEPTEIDLMQCHVGGVPVAHLPPEAQARILYQQTDEGIEEANRGKVASAARVTSSPLDKSMQERRDFLAFEAQPWDAPDPLKELADAHVRPGMRPKYLSPDKIQREGTRGYEVVKDDHGDPVKLGRMVLGQMPADKVLARNEYYRRLGDDKVEQLTAEFHEEQTRAYRDAGLRPPPAGRRPDADHGLQSIRGDSDE